MKECLCRFIGLFFLVSSVVANENRSSDLNSQLRHAAGNGNVAKCKNLLSQGAALEDRGQGGARPLFIASQEGQVEVVKLLLGGKAHVDAAKRDGATPLFIASQNGHSEAVKLLLKSNAQVDVARDDGVTPLCIASQEGHSEIVKFLLRSKAHVDSAMKDGATPLFIASKNDHSKVVKLLLRSKAAINSQTKKNKRTALHTAILHNHLDCVTALLKAGADVTVCDVQGDTPVVYAINQKNSELVDLLCTYEEETKELDSQLRHSAGSGSVEKCKNLLSQGAALEGRSQGGATPLFMASQNGHVEVVKLLLVSNAQVNTAKRDGATSLFIASQNGHDEVVKLLLVSKAQVNAARADGVTSLFIASQNGHGEVVNVLLRSKAQVDAARADGVTPLFIASQEGYVEVVKFILRSKAQVDAARDNGVTPLFIASQNCHVEVVKLLLVGKAQVDAARDTGVTPLFIASRNGHHEVVRFLLGSKAAINWQEKKGKKTALHTAVLHNHLDCVTVLLKAGADVTVCDVQGDTPIVYAINQKNSELVDLLCAYQEETKELDSQLRCAAGGGSVAKCKSLLSQGAALEGRGRGGVTPLFFASQNGHGEVVNVLLRSKAQVDAARYADGVTPLFMASQEGHAKVCQLLIDSKAAINLQTKKDKKTALHVAVLHNQLDCVTVLLKAGADVTACDEHGDTPLVYAAKQRNRELCILLGRYGAEIQGSRWSINNNRKKLSKYVQSVLTANEEGISSLDTDDLTSGRRVSHYSSVPSDKVLDHAKVLSALHTVAQEGDCGKLEMLLEFGVLVDSPNGDGYTALHLAVLGSHYEMCFQLLQYGADESIKTPQGETALEIAQRVGHKDIVELLKNSPGQEQGAVSSTDADYQTLNRFVRAIKGVPEFAAVPSVKPKNYEEILSTLHSVAQKGDCDKLEMIFGFGVPVDLRDDDGFTALHLAVREGHYPMCAELLKYGADKNISTPESETALQIAQRIGNKKLIELLSSVNSEGVVTSF